MATVGNTNSGALPGQAGDSGGPLGLAGKISRTEGELQEVTADIKTITTGDDVAVEALIKKLRFRDADAAVEALRAKEADLRKLLLHYLDKEKEARLQQQSGAGASKLLCIPKMHSTHSELRG